MCGHTKMRGNGYTRRLLRRFKLILKCFLSFWQDQQIQAQKDAIDDEIKRTIKLVGDLVDLEALENVIFIGSSLLLILDICPFQCFQICSTKSGRFSGFNCKFQVSNLPSTNCSITSTHFVKFVSLIEYFNEFLANQKTTARFELGSLVLADH